jgi:hypothetical protein
MGSSGKHDAPKTKTCQWCGGRFEFRNSRQRFGSEICARSASMARRKGKANHLRRVFIRNCAFQCPCGHREERSAIAFRTHFLNSRSFQAHQA